MHCQVEGCRFSQNHKTRDHQCGKCGKFSHGQRECGDSVKKELLMRKIDEEEYYQGRIIIAFANNKNPIKDDYYPVVVYNYDKIRKELKNDTYLLLSGGMGTSVLFKKISTSLIIMEVIGDGITREEYNNIFNNFVSNRNEQKFIYY